MSRKVGAAMQGHVFLSRCHFKSFEEKLRPHSVVEFTVQRPNGLTWRSRAGVQQLGMASNFSDVFITKPDSVPEALDWEVIRLSVGRYFADQVKWAVLETPEGPFAEHTVDVARREQFDIVAGAWLPAPSFFQRGSVPSR